MSFTTETLQFERFPLMSDEEVKTKVNAFVDDLSDTQRYRIVTPGSLETFDKDQLRSILTDYALKAQRSFNHGFVYGHDDIVMQRYYQKYNITTNTFTITIAAV